MEGVARHLNMVIPPYVPISPFKDTDAPPVLQDPVKYEIENIPSLKDSKLVRDRVKNSSSDSKTLESNHSQVSVNKIQEVRQDVNSTEEKLVETDKTRAEMNSSCITEGFSNTFGDSSSGQSKDCLESVEQERTDVSKVVNLKQEDLESGANVLQYSASPSKKVKYDQDAICKPL